MRLARPVSGLGDATALDRITGRAFRGHETQIAHQLARIAEPRQIAQLGQNRDSGNQIDAPHRLQRCGHFGERPLGHGVADRLFQTLDALLFLTHPFKKLFKGDALSRCSSFCAISQFMWVGPHVFLPG